MGKGFEFHTTRVRSDLMKKIRSKNTAPELILRKALYKLGYRYRLYTKLPGKPDLVFNKYKTVIFIDGEFWHGFQWETKKDRIKSNRDYWIGKIERNISRDKENNKKLNSLGYHVFRFWEQQIRKDLDNCLREVTSHFSKVIENISS